MCQGAAPKRTHQKTTQGLKMAPKCFRFGEPKMAFRLRHSPKNDIFGVPKIWLQKHPILETCECIEREARSSLRRQTQAWQVLVALRIQSHFQYSLFPSQLFSNSIPIHLISNSRHFQPSSCPIQFSSVPIQLISNSAHLRFVIYLSIHFWIHFAYIS